MASDSPRSISQLLDAWGRGDRAALDALVPEVYSILHQQARQALRDQRHIVLLGHVDELGCKPCFRHFARAPCL